MHKSFRRRVGLVVLFVIVCSLAQVVPIQARATPDTTCYPHEIVTLRNRVSNTFVNEDCTRTATIHAGPVNYRSATGNWLPIDGTLVPSLEPGFVENTANSYRALLPPSLSAPVLFEHGGHSVSFSLRGAVGARQVQGNAASYPQALNGVDVAFYATNTMLKEELRLRSAAATRDFVFDLRPSPGITAHLTDADSVEFVDSAGETVFSLPPPFMFEEADEEAVGPVSYVLESGIAGGYILRVVPNESWLSDPERTFPVIVDPSTGPVNPTPDCHITGGHADHETVKHCPMDLLRVGHSTGDHLTRRTMLRFDLASIPTDATVSGTQLALYAEGQGASGSVGSAYFDIHRLSTAWNSEVTWRSPYGNTTTTWSGGTFSSTIYASSYLDGTTLGWKSWSPTSLVQEWVSNPASNYGMILKQRGETTHNLFRFISMENSSTTQQPKIDVTYNTDPTAPSLTSFSDSPDPVVQGNTVTFSVGWSDPDSSSARAIICKTNPITAGSCQGDMWAMGSLTSSTPAYASYTTATSDNGTYSYYAFACDSDNLCSSSGSGTFTVNPPGPKAPTLTSHSDSPDPVVQGSAVTFSLGWSDADSSSARAVICRTNSISGGSCPGGSWASGSFTSSNPANASYTTTTSDSGTNAYYAFACDPGNLCSDSGSGTFTVNPPDTTAPAAPSITQSASSPSNSRTPTWSFTGETGGSYQCRLMRSTTVTFDFATCSSPRTYDLTGQLDGSYTFAVRQIDAAGNVSSVSSSSTYVLDTTPPSAPSITSSTHPNQTVTYPNEDPSISWSASDATTSVTAYSYVLDQVSTTDGGTASQGAGTTKSYSNLTDGTHWFHVRARDAAGNWGNTAHFQVNIDIGSPHVAPALIGPAAQLDPDRNLVVKDGDLVTFSGPITEGVGGPADSLAEITTCDLVSYDTDGVEVARRSVSLSQCRNVNGNLTGSVMTPAHTLQEGALHLEVIASRTRSGIMKSSDKAVSNFMLLDNVAPEVAGASFGCISDLVLNCEDGSSIVVTLNKAVRGDFVSADFDVSASVVLAASSDCTSTTWCDEIVLTLASTYTPGTLPTVSYNFSPLPGRTPPRDGLGRTLASGGVSTDAPPPEEATSIDATSYADDPLEPAVDVPSSADGAIVVLDDNVLQSYADNADPTCPNKFAENASNKEKPCDPAGREKRLAQRIVQLSKKNGQDGIPAAPDVLLFQETRQIDARNIAGQLNRLMKLDGRSCNLTNDRCYRVQAGSADVDIVKYANSYVVNDTAVVYNSRTMTPQGASRTFRTAYSRDESCVPKRDPLTGKKIEVDLDLDGNNDCDPDERKTKEHWMGAFTERGTAAGIVVASIHWAPSNHVKNDKVDEVWTDWANESARAISRYGRDRFGSEGADLTLMAGDFNGRRCEVQLRPETSTCDDPATLELERPRDWWTTLTGTSPVASGHGFHDAVLAANPTDLQMAKQYENGTKPASEGRRIDYIFSRSASGPPPGGGLQELHLRAHLHDLGG